MQTKLVISLFALFSLLAGFAPAQTEVPAATGLTAPQIESTPALSVARVYGVGDLLQLLNKEASFSREEAEAFLLRRVKNLKVKTEKVLFEGEQLVIFCAQEDHQAITLSLETLRNYGVRQIVLRTQVLRGQPSVVSRLPVGWQYVKSSSGDIQPVAQMGSEAAVRTAEFTEAIGAQGNQWSDVHVVPGTHVATRSSRERQDSRLPSTSDGKMVVEATSVVERAAPVLYAVLDPEQKEALEVSLLDLQEEDNEGIERLFAPNVVVFNGQLASVSDTRERPFVTGINRMLVPMPLSDQKKVEFAPETSVYKEGTTLLMRPDLLTDHQLSLAFYLQIQNIRSVDQLELPRFDGRGPMRIQIPEVAKTTFRSQISIPLGHTLVVRALERDEAGKKHNVLVLCQCDAIETARGTRAGRAPSNNSTR